MTKSNSGKLVTVIKKSHETKQNSALFKQSMLSNQYVRKEFKIRIHKAELSLCCPKQLKQDQILNDREVNDGDISDTSMLTRMEKDGALQIKR